MNSIAHDNFAAPIVEDPTSVSRNRSNLFRQFSHSKCFKYTKIILIILYALNIVGWGGMVFLILVGAANKTMPDEETRKKWIEIDSQILNALFCVTGIGLIPWRVRDLYHAYSKRNFHKLRRHHPYTMSITWIRIVVWTFIANSIFQIGMAVCMWSMDMYTRPSWLVGIFVALGCLTGAFAGLVKFILRKRNEKQAKTEQDCIEIIDH